VTDLSGWLDGGVYCVLCASGDHDKSAHDPPEHRHFLIVRDDMTVEDFGDDDESGLEIEHDGCPTELVEDTFDGTHSHTRYNCEFTDLIEQVGLTEFFRHRDDPYESRWTEPYERLAPGRYEIEAWYSYSPGGPWGGPEWDAGLRRIESDQ
jgi:hypothetical protein